MRWSLLLQKFDIEVEYISGKANVLAEFKSRMPLKQLKGMIDSDAFDLSREVPATNAIYTAYDEWKQDFNRKLASKKCKECGIAEGPGVICDRCGECWHFQCAGLSDAPAVFWYCKGCKDFIQEHNLRDFTFDEVLIDFLANGIIPVIESEERRCREAARFLRWSDNALYIKRHDEWLQVPAVATR